MKIDATIRWKIDDPSHDIKTGSTATVLVDADYVSADEGEVTAWVENTIAEDYCKSYPCGECFAIENMDEILEELAEE